MTPTEISHWSNWADPGSVNRVVHAALFVHDRSIREGLTPDLASAAAAAHAQLLIVTHVWRDDLDEVLGRKVSQ